MKWIARACELLTAISGACWIILAVSYHGVPAREDSRYILSNHGHKEEVSAFIYYLLIAFPVVFFSSFLVAAVITSWTSKRIKPGSGEPKEHPYRTTTHSRSWMDIGPTVSFWGAVLIGCGFGIWIAPWISRNSIQSEKAFFGLFALGYILGIMGNWMSRRERNDVESPPGKHS